jgi:hypothetical protein
LTASNSEQPQRKADITASLVIIGIITALFIPVWWQGLTTLLPSYQDETQWYLYRLYINKSIQSGHFPLWCPYLYAGMNFPGWGHGSAFYPPGLLLFMMPFVSAVPLNQWLHILLGTFGLYYLARSIRIKPLAACLAALWFGLGHLVPSFQEDFLPRVFVLGWCPWIYAFLYRLLETRRLKFLALAAVFMGMQWLSGHIEVVVLQYEVIGIALLALLVTRYKRKPAILPLSAAVLIMGVTLGLVQFLPALAETNRSFRTLGFSYSLFKVFTMPSFWLEPWFYWLSIANIFTLVTVIYALAHLRKDKRVLLITGLILFVFIMNFNWFNILFVLYRTPMLNRFIPHGRMLPQAFMLMALLVGIGLDYLKNAFAKKSTAGIFSLGLVLETAAAIILLYALHIHEKIQTDPVVYDVLTNFFHARLYASLALGITALVLMALVLTRPKKPFAGAVLSLIMALEFIPAAYAHIPGMPKDILDYNPEYTRFFETRKDMDRSVIVYPFDKYHQIDIPLQAGVLCETYSPDAYITLSTLRYTRFMSLLDKRAYSLEHEKVSDIQTPNILKRGDFIEPKTIPFINLLNLRYIVSQNKNIKAATHYFLAYEIERLSPLKGQLKKSDWNNIQIETPAAFGIYLYFHPGDRLRFRIKSSQKNFGNRIIIEICELLETGKRKLISEKVVDLKNRSASNMFDIHLDALWEKTTTLFVSMRPADDDTHYSLILEWPHIFNPEKHFIRLNLEDVNIFQNPTAMPRAFMVHDWEVIPEPDNRLEFMKGQEFLPDRMAVLELDPGMEKPGQKDSGKIIPGEAVSIRKYAPDDVQIMVRAVQPGILVLSDQYDPGWKAFKGEKETRIFHADEAFRAVRIDPGHSLVRFRFIPVAFAISLYFAIASWLALLMIIAAKRLKVF